MTQPTATNPPLTSMLHQAGLTLLATMQAHFCYKYLAMDYIKSRNITESDEDPRHLREMRTPSTVIDLRKR